MGIKPSLWKALVSDLPGRPTALVVEALEAAKWVSCFPHTCRGGPWSNNKLRPAQWSEIHKVKACKTLLEVVQIAKDFPDGSLAKHLGNLSYTDQPQAAAAPSSSTASSSKATQSNRPQQSESAQQAATPKQHSSSRLPAPVFKSVKKDGLKVRRNRSGKNGNQYRISINCVWGDSDFIKRKFVTQEKHVL